MPIAVGLEKGFPVEKRARPVRHVKGVRRLSKFLSRFLVCLLRREASEWTNT